MWFMYHHYIILCFFIYLPLTWVYVFIRYPIVISILLFHLEGVHLALLVRQVKCWWAPSGVAYTIRSLSLIFEEQFCKIEFAFGRFFFSFSTLNSSSHSLLAYNISADILAENLMRAHLYVTSCFSHDFQDSCFVFDF